MGGKVEGPWVGVCPAARSDPVRAGVPRDAAVWLHRALRREAAMSDYVPGDTHPSILDDETRTGAARDARVAKRRAEDARKAGRALDGILSEYGAAVYRAGYGNGWADGYAASEEHHNRHYDVPSGWTDEGTGLSDPVHAVSRG